MEIADRLSLKGWSMTLGEHDRKLSAAWENFKSGRASSLDHLLGTLKIEVQLLVGMVSLGQPDLQSQLDETRDLLLDVESELRRMRETAIPEGSRLVGSFTNITSIVQHAVEEEK